MSNKFKLFLIVASVLVMGISVFRGCERIDAGHVGIKVNMTGGNQGVSKFEYVTGWCFYWRFGQKVYEFPTYQQHKEYDSYNVPAKGGILFTVHPTFNYSLNAGEVGNMFSRYRLSLKQLEEGYLKTTMTTTIREITNTFTVDSILNNQAIYDAAILEKLNLQLKPYFQVTQFTANLVPDPALKESITNKAKNLQEAQAKIAEVQTTQAQAIIDITNARKDSTVVVVKASADAEAIRLKTKEITPNYVEYIKWLNAAENVDRVPKTVLGNGSGLLYNLNK